MSQILKQINEISIELTQIEVSLKELDVPKRIADSTLKAYAQAQNQINELNRQNELYVTKEKLKLIFVP